jgi:hypothetical protein
LILFNQIGQRVVIQFLQETLRGFGKCLFQAASGSNVLSRAGYVTAVRGKNGGIRLGKPAKMIRVGDVVRDLEPLSLVNCSSEFCHITPLIILTI